jgi:hypothetical protein
LGSARIPAHHNHPRYRV